MKLLTVILGTAVLAAATQADATIYVGMQLGNGAITNVANDGGTGNLAIAGLVFGDFTNNIIVQGYPTVDQPELHSASIDTTKAAGTGSTLTIYITQTDLDPISGSILNSFTSNSLSGAAISVKESTLLSTSNSLFDGVELASQTFTALGSRDYITALPSITGPFSETAKYVLTTGAGKSSFNDTIDITAGPVPDAATWAMMFVGFGLMGTTLRQRRRTAVNFG